MKVELIKYRYLLFIIKAVINNEGFIYALEVL